MGLLLGQSLLLLISFDNNETANMYLLILFNINHSFLRGGGGGYAHYAWYAMKLGPLAIGMKSYQCQLASAIATPPVQPAYVPYLLRKVIVSLYIQFLVG